MYNTFREKVLMMAMMFSSIFGGMTREKARYTVKRSMRKSKNRKPKPVEGMPKTGQTVRVYTKYGTDHVCKYFHKLFVPCYKPYTFSPSEIVSWKEIMK